MKLLFLLAFLALASVLQAQTAADSGTYLVYLNGSLVAEENYAAENLPDGATRTTSQMTAGIAKATFITTTKNRRPVEFAVETGGTRALTAAFDGGGAVKISITSLPEKLLKTRASVVLENNVWSQFRDLLAQYDAAKGGAQRFVAFLPSQSLDLNLTLERTGREEIKNKTATVAVEKFKLQHEGGLTIEIWQDTASRAPVLIEIKQQNVRVVRKNFEFLLDAPKTVKTFAGEFTSEEVEFNNGAIKLAGTLTVPKTDKKPFPAVVLISGSGGQDRDGSTHLNIYKQIAESLSKAGIAVLRVDDRGTGKSGALAGGGSSYRDLIADSRAAFDFLTTRPEIDKNRIAFVGHSEGSETALTLAAEDKRVFAVALLAGVSSQFLPVVNEQDLYQRALIETIDPADETARKPIVKSLNQQFADAAKPENAANPRYNYFRDHLASYPLKLAEQVKQPVLIVQGERDRQVLAHHAVELAQALTRGGNRNVRLRILPDLSHIFTAVSESAAPRVSDEFLLTLQTWASETLKAER